MHGGSLTAVDITKHHGADVVLEDVSLVVACDSRIGIVGPNGIGKTTLLRVLAGLDDPGTGRVVRNPAGLAVGYLPQESEVLPRETVRGYLARRTGVAAAEQKLDVLADRLEREPELAQDFTDALDQLLALGGGDLDSRAGEALAEVGLAAGLERQAATLSGGERARVSLASLILARFDVLLLDEPTNDLDFEGLDRLEHRLTGFRGGLVVVSHDREFLDRTVTRVVEIEEGSRRAREYAGGWSAYEAQRLRARTRQAAEHAEFDERRTQLQGLVATRRAQARGGGRQADRRGTHALSTKVRQAERQLDRLKPVDKPWQPWELQLSLAPRQRGGDVVARLEAAVVERGSFRLGPVDLELRSGERLALLGPNGSGKTTLLCALLGRLPLGAGRRLVGPGVVLGELDQGRAGSRARSRSSKRFQALAKTRARCSRSSACGRRTRSGPAGRCLPESAPAQRSRSWLSRASTASSSTSRRIISICRRSRSSSQRSKPTRAQSCSSHTTGASSSGFARRGRSSCSGGRAAESPVRAAILPGRSWPSRRRRPRRHAGTSAVRNTRSRRLASTSAPTAASRSGPTTPAPRA